MQKFCGKLAVWQLVLMGLPLASISVAQAATVIDLSKQNPSIFQSIMATNGANIEETSRLVDVNQTMHVRVQQTHLGYPVYGADGVVHILHGNKTPASIRGVMAVGSHSFMNGQMYAGLQQDLANTPAYVLNQVQAEKIMQFAIQHYHAQVGKKTEIRSPAVERLVYIDEQNKAHWAYKVSFRAPSDHARGVPAQPTFIIDAMSMSIYKAWDDIKTAGKPDLVPAVGGGFGGNKKMGQLSYDGSEKNLPTLDIMRDASANMCYLQNSIVKVKKCTDSDWFGCDKTVDFKLACEAPSQNHPGIYWNGDLDAVNGGYSPSNDALFNGEIIHDMYQNWYNLPVLVDKKGKPEILTMVVHLDMDNAYWSDAEQSMNFGDGISTFYPLTSLGVAAHEISHGFTSQYSNLEYAGESGGMNEAFSDMAAQAAEYYAYHQHDGWTNNWQIGPEIFKEDKALRYMDMPSKDCESGEKPGRDCSIDTADQIKRGTDVHLSSGVYNRAYYLIATAPGYDARKAFDVMVNANMHYWTKNATFASGACGVLQAATDLGYATQPIYDAFATVKVDASKCEIKNTRQA